MVGADIARDMPWVGGGTPEALLRPVISVDLSPLLDAWPPMIPSKQEQQTPIVRVSRLIYERGIGVVCWGVAS